MRLGGEVIKGIFDFVTTYGSRGLEALGEGVKRQLSKGQADQLVDQAKKADKVLGEAGAETVEQGQRLVLKKPDGELIETPIGKVPKPPEPPVTPKVADDATEAATEAVEEAGEAATKRSRLRPDGRSIKRQIATGTAKTAGAVIPPALVAGLGVSQGERINEAIKDQINQLRQVPEVAAVTDMLAPKVSAIKDMLTPPPVDTGERVELTESVMEQVDLNKDGKISDEERKAIKEKADQAVAAQQKPETGTPVPEATGIMKFLFGKDGIGGDPGAVGKTMDYLADPRTRYALARAAESRPGVVDRNFFTDFTLGQAEYDQLQGKDETALMQNYEFLKQAGKSDDEIFDLLVGKTSQSDTLSLFVDLEQEIYDGLLKRPEYLDTEPDADGLTGLQRAARDARIIARQRLGGVLGGQTSAPQDSEVVQTVDIE
jgi:hypothetical protein